MSDRWQTGRIAAAVSALMLIVGLTTACDLSQVVLSGRVTLIGSATGAGGVPVEVFSNTSETPVLETSTGSGGNYVVRTSTLPAGTYRLRFGSTWYGGDEWATATPVSVGTSAATVADAEVPRTATFTGSITSGGVPLAGIEVIAVTPEDRGIGVAWTGADGGWVLPVTASSDLRFLLFDASDAWAPIWVGGADDPAVFPPSTDRNLPPIDIADGVRFEPPKRTLQSLASGGAQADAKSTGQALSADGRYLTFCSDATNLVPGDTNGVSDVFRRDLVTGAVVRVSVASDGSQSNGRSGGKRVSMSADGRFVAFGSEATNLVAGDTNGVADIFVHDLVTGTTERVSVASDGTQGNGGVPLTNPGVGTRSIYDVSMSADGRFVAFGSEATNLIAGDTNGVADIFVHDLVTGTTERVSVAPDGTQGDGRSFDPSISADGGAVAFTSTATNLGGDDGSGRWIVFIRDLTHQTTIRIDPPVGRFGLSYMSNASLSADGQKVAFISRYAVPDGQKTGKANVFVYDRTSDTTVVASVNASGATGNDDTFSATISADGRYVVFNSWATNLVAGTGFSLESTYLRDLQNGVTSKVNQKSDGTDSAEPGDLLAPPAISADGRHIAFVTAGNTFDSPDVGTIEDIYVYDLAVVAAD